MEIEPEHPAAFPLSLRIPNWCAHPRLAVNANAVNAAPDAKGFVRLERTWRSGDTITIELPMVPRVETGLDVNVINKTPYLPERDALHRAGGVRQAAPFAAVSCGPLLFALGIPEAPGTTDGNTPATDARWTYALEDLTGKDIVVERDAMPPRWDWPLTSPLRLRVQGVRCEWRPGDYEPLPLDPVPDGPRETLTLVPYGCTRFRISMFPVTERAWRSCHRAWSDLTPFVKALRVSQPAPVPDGEGRLAYPEGEAAPGLEWKTFADAHCSVESGATRVAAEGSAQRVIYEACFTCAEPMRLEGCLGYDGPTQMWLDGRLIHDDPDGTRIAMLPADVRAQWPTTRLTPDAARIAFEADAGKHVLRIARGLLSDRDPGIFLRFRRLDMPAFNPEVRPALPVVTQEKPMKGTESRRSDWD